MGMVVDITHLPKRLAYVRESSRLMALQAPTTAAFLGSYGDKLALANDRDILPKQQSLSRFESCSRCGNQMIPGLTCVVRRQRTPGRFKGSEHKVQKVHRIQNMVYQCRRCDAVAQREIIKQQPLTVPPKAVPSAPSLASPAPAETIVPSASANASSKKRAKARKQGGLQSLLEKSKATSSKLQTGFGLDLMDFMQSS